MPLGGDFAKLGRLAARLPLITKEAKASAIQAMADTALSLVHQNFAAERTPTGSAWKPRASGSGKLEVKSGSLAASFDATVKGDSVSLSNPTPYFVYQQKGTKKIPARPMLPTHGLPDAWQTAMLNAASVKVDEAFAELTH